MTAEQWLDARQPAPPEPLKTRLRELIANAPPNADLGELMLERGTTLLESILRGDATSRDCAHDLLAADALVTYAFEAAGETPADLESRARAAMRRIARLGAEVGS